jgi:hypothetical protein
MGPDLLGDSDENVRQLAPLWNGLLHEFRNHLSTLTAATTELRGEIQPSFSVHLAAAVAETERSVQSLTSLIALVEASVRAVEPMISDLDGVVERAIRLAAPAVGRRVSITAQLGRKTGVKNRGSALEGLLASLIVDLGRAYAAESHGLEAPRPHEVRIHAELSRSGLAIEVSSDGARPSASSWRYLMARELADRLDATLSVSPDASTFLVQFR